MKEPTEAQRITDESKSRAGMVLPPAHMVVCSDTIRLPRGGSCRVRLTVPRYGGNLVPSVAGEKASYRLDELFPRVFNLLSSMMTPDKVPNSFHTAEVLQTENRGAQRAKDAVETQEILSTKKANAATQKQRVSNTKKKKKPRRAMKNVPVSENLRHDFSKDAQDSQTSKAERTGHDTNRKAEHAHGSNTKPQQKVVSLPSCHLPFSYAMYRQQRRMAAGKQKKVRKKDKRVSFFEEFNRHVEHLVLAYLCRCIQWTEQDETPGNKQATLLFTQGCYDTSYVSVYYEEQFWCGLKRTHYRRVGEVWDPLRGVLLSARTLAPQAYHVLCRICRADGQATPDPYRYYVDAAGAVVFFLSVPLHEREIRRGKVPVMCVNAQTLCQKGKIDQLRRTSNSQLLDST